jgi:hypothetical protein
MPVLTWSLVGGGALLLLYAALVVALFISGRRESARALAGFIPDCIVLCGRLLGDPRVPPRKKALLVALAGYLAGAICLRAHARACVTKKRSVPLGRYRRGRVPPPASDLTADSLATRYGRWRTSGLYRLSRKDQ